MSDIIGKLRERLRNVSVEDDLIVFDRKDIDTKNFTLKELFQACSQELENTTDLKKRGFLQNTMAESLLFSMQSKIARDIAIETAENPEMYSQLRAYACAIIAQTYFHEKDFNSAEEYCKKALALSILAQSCV